MSIAEEKRKIREKIWKLLTERGIARHPLPCSGRIPNFEGSKKAAENLVKLEEWKEAKIIFSNPDFAQKPIREFALRQGKILIMATPRLKSGYLIIRSEDVKGKEDFAATIKGAFKFGKKLKELLKPDLIITGCVAVDLRGNRLGKGGGYGDKEISTLRKMFGYIKVATSIHDLQIVDVVPIEEHDEKVDIIATPRRVIKIKS